MKYYTWNWAREYRGRSFRSVEPLFNNIHSDIENPGRNNLHFGNNNLNFYKVQYSSENITYQQKKRLV